MDKKLLKWNFIFQYGWVLTNIFNSILLLPLYIHKIDSNTLGIWLATGAVLGWMTLVDPGVGEVLQQRIAEHRGRAEKSELGKLIGSGYWASLYVLFIALAVGVGVYFFLPRMIDKNIAAYPFLSPALFISVLATGLSLVSFTMSGINQGLHNSQQVAICSLAANFLFLAINLLFLYLGYGVLSIALANLFRAVYINFHNIISMFQVMKREAITIVFDKAHFKSFIKIFSFTSSSKIITGLAYSVDMIVLARFIQPSAITMYEVNRRPISISYSLIGRHSVALMPLISHSKGMDDKPSILKLINEQFRIYMYATLFISLCFIFNHANLISAWTGPGKTVEPLLLYLFVAQFFFSLVATFMANVDYALGDIKVNSMYNIIRNLFYGVLMFFAAKSYGIMGAVLGSLLVSATVDFAFYYYRVHKLGYLQLSLLTNLLRTWVFVLPLAVGGGWGISYLVNELLPATHYFARMLVSGGAFTFYFLLLLILVDAPVRTQVRGLTGRYIGLPFTKLKRA